MSEDRELVERLAAIDATPRAGWVAELRADLDAAWETDDPGDVDSLRMTTVTLIDNEPTPPEPSGGRRGAGLIAVAAAVVVAVVVLVVFDRDDVAPADQPSPTVTVPAASPPRRLHATLGMEQLEPGTYYVDEVSGTPTPRIFATIGAGWRDRSTSPGWDIAKRDAYTDAEVGVDDFHQHEIGFMTFSNPVAVYSDACHWEDGYHPGPVDTLDGLVAALTEQQGWAEVTVPSDISVDGYVGKAFQRTAPADMSDCSTRVYRTRAHSDVLGTNPDFRSWDTPDAPDGESWGDHYHEPGEIETLWVLDLDGTVVVIQTGVWPEPSAGAAPDFAADVLDSIHIARPLLNVPGALEPGTYYVDEVNRTPTPRIFATLDAGWADRDTRRGWAHIAKGGMPDEGGIGYIEFSNPVAVFSDACHPTDGFYPGSVATVDEFVTALRQQQGGWVDVTVPSDISVDGYDGKAFQRTAPATMSDCTTRNGETRPSNHAFFPSWESSEGINMGYEPGQIETLWVLDIDGTVIVISTELWPGPSATAQADFADSVLDSIRINQS